MFKNGTIQDVIVRNLTKFIDDRGWLSELFRKDEFPAELYPAMGYVSMTASGVTRGPHEHADQADCFAFLGPSNFKIFLWDNRTSSPTYMTRQGMVLNFPNRLYAGEGKKNPVDEIRHEIDAASIFRTE